MSHHQPLQVFSFGYCGWGNATKQLIQSVDAVEASRGYRPPAFVDVRIRRQVRAIGFVGRAFEEVLGPRRHRWMPKLGNRAIVTRSGPPIQIVEPSTAAALLDFALEAAAERRRVIFFCGCQFAKEDGRVRCHRHRVATLLLKAARDRGESIEVVEWPGGEPQHLDLNATPSVFRAVRNGRRNIPVAGRHPLSEIAGLPWGSTLTLRSQEEVLHRLVGPATWTAQGWSMPVPWKWIDSSASLESCARHAASSRRLYGMEPRRTTSDSTWLLSPVLKGRRR